MAVRHTLPSIVEKAYGDWERKKLNIVSPLSEIRLGGLSNEGNKQCDKHLFKSFVRVTVCKAFVCTLGIGLSDYLQSIIHQHIMITFVFSDYLQQDVVLETPGEQRQAQGLSQKFQQS